MIKEELAQADLTDKFNKREKLSNQEEVRVPKTSKVTTNLKTTGKIMVSKWAKHQKLTNRLIFRKTRLRGKIDLKNQTIIEEGEQKIVIFKSLKNLIKKKNMGK